MEPHNSGDKVLELYDVQQGWIPFREAYLIEAMEYQLRYSGDSVDIRIQEVPVPFYKKGHLFCATFLTPFQSGTLQLKVNGIEHQVHVYPDNRKLTEEQYNHMLEEILEEANICFQLSGLETMVNTSERSRELSWPQWSYVEKSFFQLRQIYAKIQQQPIRRLEKFPVMMKRERVQKSEFVTLRWLDRKGYGKDIPMNVENVRTFETRNVYENQVIKQQIHDLSRLLGKYEGVTDTRIAMKAKKYRLIIQGWLVSSFLKEVTENKGPFTVTQAFRKHPLYRLWYQWFDRLYKHNRAGIGFDYPISLKDTFFLYEMWCFMMVVKILREAGLAVDTRDLFRKKKEGLFLNLAENKESCIRLQGNQSLYFQRTYQSNTKPFYTYTQRMIPDIVIEGENGIVIFDPKYRVPHNLGTALGEMHKYRDGILQKETGNHAVRQVFILTPTKEDQVDSIKYFQDAFHDTYQMGAIQMLPGVANEMVKKKILACLDTVL